MARPKRTPSARIRTMCQWATRTATRTRRSRVIDTFGGFSVYIFNSQINIQAGKKKTEGLRSVISNVLAKQTATEDSRDSSQVGFICMN